MPIWPVSFVDGSVQVADADGAFYPITMSGVPVPEFNAGWSARGLQTGLPPFHILELVHADHPGTYWMLDSALEFRSNAANTLTGPTRDLFLQHAEPLVRNLFDEAVKAPHAAVPSASHAFEGFLVENVHNLIAAVVPTVPGQPDVVSVASLGAIGTSYTHSGITFQVARIEQTLQSAAASLARISIPSPLDDGVELASQEKLELPGHSAFRFLDRDTGLVFYLLIGRTSGDRHLYVPSASVVFTSGPATAAHDPLTLLLVYYATNTNRIVMLPEAEGLEPGLVHIVPPPQTGLDEPPTLHAEPAAAPAASRSDERVLHTAYATPVAESIRTARPVAPVRAASPPPPPNWWQRLLGLGNG
ncbi:MAG: hypothetical protein ACRYGI_18385 [Janthinobacterium lividum]